MPGDEPGLPRARLPRCARVSGTASGLVLIDKARGWTSHDAVARTRRLAGTRKVGHAGTLDPMATGLLILGINSSTRLLTWVVGLDKEYFATIRLGASTTTDDAEGEQLDRATPASVASITPDAITAGIIALTGDISQRPSAVSAIKVDGKRAYARVRAGEDVQLAARPVTVSEFELIDSVESDGFLDLRVRVVCSSGTYIRALARDLGDALGVGGHLTALRRTRIGPFGVDAAQGLETLDVAAALIGPAKAASLLFPRLELTTEQAVDLGHGKRIDVDAAKVTFPVETARSAGNSRPEVPQSEHVEASAAATGPGAVTGPVAAIAPDGRLVGLVEFRGAQAKTLVNFPADEAQDQRAQQPKAQDQKGQDQSAEDQKGQDQRAEDQKGQDQRGQDPKPQDPKPNAQSAGKPVANEDGTA
ncbi:MAG: tRNA pseudouridine(55) synthase TruB [Microbacteriaceae bacterium]|nr:tRNA pseudouridine(55) synthase TruB [Microbacteriaceae bacterium]